MRLLANYVSGLFSGLRFRLLLLVAVVCSPLIGLTLHRAGEDRRRAMAGWQQRSQQLMQLASRQEDKVIGETRQLLAAMGESESIRTNNPAACRQLVNGLFANDPRYANLAVMNSSGEILASAVSMG